MKNHVSWKRDTEGMGVAAKWQNGDGRKASGGRFVDDYLAYLLARVSHGISGQFHQQVRATGLSVPEWRVLASLAGGGGVPVGELAALILAQQPTVTKLVDRMTASGLVRRGRSAGDGRQRLVYITATGRRRVGPLLAAAKRHEAAVLAELGAADASRLKDILRRLIDTAG
jgi:DNA-binding MarR family transcriptional regulator